MDGNHDTMEKPMAEEKLVFQAEVSKLLDIVARSLYSDKEIFLRELISNASDACDKLRYAALMAPDLIADDPGFKITLAIDKKARTLTVADNGIGMDRDELIENLGTIARSGTSAFVDGLTGDESKDMALIGQFGVGFYSAFMVADSVEVMTRKAGEAACWRWVSDGKGGFTVAEAAPEDTPARGTRIVIHLSKAEKEFLEPERLRHIVKTYSDHIGLPILLGGEDGGAADQLNTASALWTRPKREIEADQYTEFYHHVSHGFDEPWLTLHNKAEGRLEYTSLLFVPSARPFDLFDPARKASVKLYVRRVFITDDCEGLLPPWLRFLRGIVDSEDLPLNLSREMLQDNPMLARIKVALTKRVLGELKKKAEKEPEGYAAFWENFGAVLKEGIYEDADRRADILEISRFHTTAADGGLVSLADYVARLKPGQDAIYYLSGADLEGLGRSPQIEGFRARGVEVLLLTDPVDQFWLPTVGEFEGKPFRSVTQGGADLAALGKGEGDDKEDATDEATASGIDSLVAMFKLALSDHVKDVRASERLTDSAVCLVADEGDMDMHLERMLRQQRQVGVPSKRILELNPRHPLIRRLAGAVSGSDAAERIADAAYLLLDQARIMEGEKLPDPIAFSQRLASVMERGMAG
jgi:molecular chaperone HtpG